MKNRILKILSLLFINALFNLFPSTITNGCADGGDEEDWFYSFFSPFVLDEPAMRPFFLSYHQWYPSEEEEDEWPADNEAELNTGEWAKFFKDKVTANDMAVILSTKVSDQTMAGLAQYIAKKDFLVPAILTGNTLLSYPDKKQAADACSYLAFAKSYEDTPEQYWNPNPRTVSDAAHGAFEAENAQAKTQYEFLKNRYRFHRMRLNFQAKQYQNCISIYEDEVKKSSVQGTMKYRMMGYYAAALYKTKKYAEANYYYALIYEQFPPRRDDALWSFHPQNDADWNASLALATNSREKEVLWLMFGYYADPLLAMKKIYAINPRSDLLGILLVRSVNAAEKSMLPDNSNIDIVQDNTYWEYSKAPSNAELTSFMKSVADSGNTLKPSLWDLSAGYMCFMQHDHLNARSYFQKVKQNKASNPLSVESAVYFESIMKLFEAIKIDKTFEDDFFPELTAMYGRKTDHHSDDLFDYSMRLLEKKYSWQGNPLKAELCRYGYRWQYEFYLEDKNIQQMIDFMDRTDKSPYENFLLSLYSLKKKDLIETQAVAFMYDGMIKESIEKFELLASSGETVLLGNPFNIHVKDCHDCDHEAPQKTKYTKLSFVKKMQEIEQIALQKGKEAAQNYFLLANGYYNMTYYGNARVFRSTAVYHEAYGIKYYDKEIDGRNNAIENPYYDCTRAKMYYQKALELSPNKEFSAKCHWMILKCNLNISYETDGEEGYPKTLIANGFYNPILEKYRDTKYYQEIIAQCGYLRDHLAAGKK